MRVLVCGGRDFNDKDMLDICMRRIEFDSIGGISCIIHGDARGADTIAKIWAEDNDVECDAYPADWKRFGKSAGFIRNRQMLEEGEPDLVVGFPGGKGTANMVSLAKKAGVEVIEVP